MKQAVAVFQLCMVSFCLVISACEVKTPVSHLPSDVSWALTSGYIDSLPRRHCECVSPRITQVTLSLAHDQGVDLSSLELLVSMDGLVDLDTLTSQHHFFVDFCSCDDNDYFTFHVYGIDRKKGMVYMWTEKEVHPVGGAKAFELSLSSTDTEGSNLSALTR